MTDGGKRDYRPQPLWRWGLVFCGWGLVIVAVVIGPIPGPWSLPLAALGIAILYKNSPWIRAWLRKARRDYPWAADPVRRALNRANHPSDKRRN